MSCPIRILHVLASMQRAGAETFLMNYYRVIDREKFQFDFAVSADHKCAYDDEIIALGGNIYHYPRYRGSNHFQYTKWWNEFFSSHPEYKIVHGHIGSTACIYLHIAKKHGCYAIAHSHSTSGERSLHGLLYKMFSYPTRYIADYFFGCSWAAAESRYGKKIANDSTKCSILKNAIDTSRFAFNPEMRRNLRMQLDLDEDTLVVGTVGRLTIQKNPYFILDIIQELKRESPKARFLWVGNGEMESEIKEELRKRGLTDFVIMAGTLPDVEKMYWIMDVFILPSLWEGLPVSVIEAQASGLPCIISDQITEEVCITSHIQRFPLDDSICQWVKGIIDCKYEPRVSPNQQIKDAGYDVYNMAGWLEAFYAARYSK